MIADGNGQRAAGAAFAGDGDDDGHRQARHLAQIMRDGFGLTALFGVDSGIGSRRVDEGEDRPAEILRPAASREGICDSPPASPCPKFRASALLGVAAFLVAHHHDGASVKSRKSGDQRRIISIRAVAVNFGEVRKKQADVIERVRTFGMARHLRALPRTKIREEFVLEFVDLFAKAVDFAVGMIGGNSAQVFDVALETPNFFAAIVGCHDYRPPAAVPRTISTESEPQSSRTFEINARSARTCCFDSRVTTVPSGDWRSNTTLQPPGCALSISLS